MRPPHEVDSAPSFALEIAMVPRFGLEVSPGQDRRRRLLAGVASSGPAAGPYLPALLAPAGRAAAGAGRARPADHSRGAGGQRHRPRPSPPRRPCPAPRGRAGVPTVGVTTRPLVAEGPWPADQRGATTPLLVGGEVVGWWVRTRAGAKPVAVHAAWQSDAQAAVQVVLAATRRARTPEPLRRARTLARTRRAHSR
jgi:deoxyribonuclease V